MWQAPTYAHIHACPADSYIHTCFADSHTCANPGRRTLTDSGVAGV